MAKRSLDFWFEFASTYSYPAAMRISALAEASGVDVRWRPFILGPIFKAQGWATSPFNLYSAKGRNMWRDLERICATHIGGDKFFRHVSLELVHASFAVPHLIVHIAAFLVAENGHTFKESLDQVTCGGG
jgi:2-hydroxychromene-2-carboxylate isomerase